MSILNLIGRLQEGKHETYPVASDDDILMSENALCVVLPGSFKVFAKEFSNGAYLYMVQEVCSVGEGNAQISPVQNICHSRKEKDTWIISNKGERFRLKDLIPFSLDANGNKWCFIYDSSVPKNEYSVTYYDTHGIKLFGKLSNFTEWLRIIVENQKEVIRVVLDDLTIYDELGLG